MPSRKAEERRLVTTLGLVSKLGAGAVQIRHDDAEKETGGPNVWTCLAFSENGQPHWEIGAGFDPLTAATRLAQSIVDGATCASCDRFTVLDVEWLPPRPWPAAVPVCKVQYHAKRDAFFRACQAKEVNRP